jgi:glucose/arabinose dehydrogenase
MSHDISTVESPMNLRRNLILTGIGALPICAVLAAQQRQPQLPAPSQAHPNPSRVIPRPDGAQLKVPEGFSVSIYADDLQAARMMAWAPNGDLFVSQTAAARISVLRDTNNHGTPDMRTVFVQGPLPAPRGGPPPGAAAAGGAARGGAPAQPVCTGDGVGGRQPLGLAFQPGYLYVGYTDCVVRYKYQAGDTQASQPERLVDLPGGGNHFARNVAFSRDGKKMYVTVGSASNNNEGEDVRRAAINEYNADGTGFRIFASGLRNPTALAWQPGTNTLWTSVNERDNLGDDLVPDYFTSVKEGGFYGWPFSYIGQNYDPIHVGKLPNLVRTALVPDVLLPAHAAALGATFYTGNQFPQRFRNGAFVAMHGSWNRSKANGYKVGFVPFQNGKPGPMEDFLTGFVVNDGTEGQITTWGRPVGVTVGRDGSLLVSDDAGNRIWKVSYAATR